MNKQLILAAQKRFAALKRFICSLPVLTLTIVVAALLTGCQTPSNDFAIASAQLSAAAEPITLREGDTLKITFPSSPSLNTSQQIRRDGKINMPLVGEVDAAGMTTAALEKKLVDLYATQLVSKQVTVEVVNSTFPVYVTGMVLRPGKISSDHPLTVLEAVMEAGGPDYNKANLKAVAVIRREGSSMKRYVLNLKASLDGQDSQPFYLKPSDIVYVPERFNMF